jgi:D-alanyl-D-alanine carboxypeptidase
MASTTKTYTAAAVLRLAEDGKLGLDDPIAKHLPGPYLALLASDGYDTGAITIRQVLSQTSGIYDYAFGPGSDFAEVALTDLSHRWTRRDQVEFAVRVGAPIGPPGTAYHYSDTGYILLGEIIEQKTGLSLAAALRQLLGFEALGLQSTYLESLEPVPAGVKERAHQYAGDTDSFGADPSFDLYGGGGLVATVSDMADFFAALVGGRVFHEPETLQHMLTVPAVTDSSGGAYALGISRQQFGSNACWGHGGFWGTIALSCIPSGVTIAYSVNQNEGTGPVRQRLLQLVASELGLLP